MRAMRLVSAAAALALGGAGVAGCGSDDNSAIPVLLVGTASGVAVFDGATGSVGPAAATSASSPDGSVLARSMVVGARTHLRVVDVGRGTDRWTSTLDGSLEPRVVSADADRIALIPQPGPVLPGALAPGRTTTEVVVAHDDGEVERLDVEGNVEPEAFSLDGSALFVLQFLPSEQPTHYQVRRLDLDTGELGDVFSVDADLQQAMGGTARTHVWDPDGSRLYTLYTQEVGADVVAFVHVLDLDEQWAHCIDLPAGFTPSSAGLALDESGRHLYVADAVGGVVAAVDTEALTVETSADVAPTLTAIASPIAVMGDELVVGGGTAVRRLDRETLEQVDWFDVGTDVLGVVPSTSDGELYVATAAAVELRDVETAEVLRRTPADPTMGSFTGLGPRTTIVYTNIQCAC